MRRNEATLRSGVKMKATQLIQATIEVDKGA